MIRKSRFFKIIVLICWVVFFSAVLHAQDKKVLSFTVGTHASSNVTDVYFHFLEIAFSELGYKLTLEKVPIKRAYMGVDNGFFDGMVIVPEGLEKNYPNVVIIPEALTRIDAMVITNGQWIEVNGLESIKPYKIGIIRGYAIAEKLTEGMKRQIVNSHESLLSMLELGRIDIAIAMKRETRRFLKKHREFKNILLVEPPLYTLKLYPCLNKKHKVLAEQVTPVIRRLIKEKVLEELYAPYKI